MKRSDWLISGSLAVFFLFVLGGIMVYWLQANAYANLPTTLPDALPEALASRGEAGAGNGVTAKDAFDSTGERATQWQVDAGVVSATATILQFDQLEDIYGGGANWTVVYYSPIESLVATFTVNGKKADFLSAKQIENVPQIIDPETIKLDSAQAMTLAVSNGGLELLRDGTAQRVAHLSLRKQPNSGRVEWQIVIQNETSGAHLTFRIDAISGEILEKSGL